MRTLVGNELMSKLSENSHSCKKKFEEVLLDEVYTNQVGEGGGGGY